MSRNKWKTKQHRETEVMLRKNGYERISSRGDHFKYSNGKRTIVIPGGCNRMVMRRLIKENNLEV